MKRFLLGLTLVAALAFGQVTSIPSATGGTAGPAGPAGPIGPAGPAGADGAPGVPGYSPNSLQSGGGVAWISGLDFTVSAAIYTINNTQEMSAQTDVTLSAAHETLNRFDAIVLTSDGTAVVVEGTPAENAAIPDIDPSTQLYLTAIYVPAGATEPSNTVLTDIYHENTEWTTSRNGTTITLASTNNPYDGTVTLEATNATSGNYVQFAAPAPLDLATRNNLVFYIRSKAAWASTRNLQIAWYSTNAKMGSTVVLSQAAFGFTSSNTTTYQQIVIPLSLFQASGLSVNRLRITVGGSGTNIGWYLDAVTLQGGVLPGSASTALVWKGAWVTSTAYAVNDVVSYNGTAWAALAGNIASAPTAANTNWARMVNNVRTDHLVFNAGVCQSGVAGTGFNLVSTDDPAISCQSGTNTNFATLDFDATAVECAQVHFHLPSDVDLAQLVAVSFKWFATATTGSVVWSAETTCVAVGEAYDAAFNAASTVTSSVSETTTLLNVGSIAAVTTTGCAADEEMFLRLCRDADAVADDMTGDAKLVAVGVTLRRIQ